MTNLEQAQAISIAARREYDVAYAHCLRLKRIADDAARVCAVLLDGKLEAGKWKNAPL